VLPLGLRGGSADVISNLYRQMIEEVVGVVIVTEAFGDGTGEAALDTVDALVDLIVNGIAGWAPGDEIGSFRLVSGRLVSLAQGTVIYQIDFAISDQLRITT